jgi:hypothetical protein
MRAKMLVRVDGTPAPGPSAPDRRATVRLQRYWSSLRQSGGCPYFADFRPDRNPIDWENCLLISRRSDGDFSVDHFGGAYERVFGTALASALRAGSTTRAFLTLFGDPAGALLRSQPVERDGEVVGRQPGQIVLYRSILLPFVDLEGRPAYVLGAFTFTERRVSERP